MISGSKIKFMSIFITSRRQKLENKSTCEVVIQPGGAFWV